MRKSLLLFFCFLAFHPSLYADENVYGAAHCVVDIDDQKDPLTRAALLNCASAYRVPERPNLYVDINVAQVNRCLRDSEITEFPCDKRPYLRREIRDLEVAQACRSWVFPYRGKKVFTLEDKFKQCLGIFQNLKKGQEKEEQALKKRIDQLKRNQRWGVSTPPCQAENTVYNVALCMHQNCYEDIDALGETMCMPEQQRRDNPDYWFEQCIDQQWAGGKRLGMEEAANKKDMARDAGRSCQDCFSIMKTTTPNPCRVKTLMACVEGRLESRCNN